MRLFEYHLGSPHFENLLAGGVQGYQNSSPLEFGSGECMGNLIRYPQSQCLDRNVWAGASRNLNFCL